MVFQYDVLNDNLSETFGEVTWKYKIDELLDKLLDSLNELNNRNDLTVKTTDLLNELLKTLKIKDCTDCKGNTGRYNLDGLHGSINTIENILANLEKGQKWGNIMCCLNKELFEIDHKLNKKLLCENCKEKEIKKLTDKCGSKEIARFLYQCKLNANIYSHYYKFYNYIQWIPFDEYRNIEYLAKGVFGEVYKATWINSYYNHHEEKYKDQNVVLKRIHNNSSDDKITDILKEVK